MGGVTASLFRTGMNTVFELAYVPCTGAAHQAQHARRSSEPRTRCAPPLRQCRAAGLPAPPPAAWPRLPHLPPRGGCPSAWQRHPAGLRGGGGGRGWGRCGVVWCQDQKEGQAALRGWGREQPALRLQQPSASRRCHLPACRQMHAVHPQDTLPLPTHTRAGTHPPPTPCSASAAAAPPAGAAEHLPGRGRAAPAGDRAAPGHLQADKAAGRRTGLQREC